jgi:hypothetical protein
MKSPPRTLGLTLGLLLCSMLLFPSFATAGERDDQIGSADTSMVVSVTTASDAIVVVADPGMNMCVVDYSINVDHAMLLVPDTADTADTPISAVWQNLDIAISNIYLESRSYLHTPPVFRYRRLDNNANYNMATRNVVEPRRILILRV